MKKFLTLLLLSLPLPVAADARLEQPVQAELGIVAIVNDEVITSLDVADRMAFIVATTKLTSSPETISRLIPQVTRQLIDEKLQVQEAKRHGINVSHADVVHATTAIAGRRGIDKDVLYNELIALGIEKETYEEQLKAQIAWRKVVARRVRPDVKVSDAEVERARLTDSLKLTAEGSIEVNIVNFVLPVAKPEEEAEVKALANKLVGDLRKGAKFEEVAEQFSPGSNAPKPIWVPLAELEPNLASVLKKAVPGSVSSPSRTQEGYVIIKLLNRRGIASAKVNDSELLLKDILLSLSPEDEALAAELSLTLAREVARHPGSCESESLEGIDGLDDMNMSVQFINARFNELSQPIQKMVSKLIVGAVSEPFASPEGIRILMLCERTDAPPEMATAEATYAQLMGRKLELNAKKYMRNLRRDAFIEFRK